MTGMGAVGMREKKWAGASGMFYIGDGGTPGNDFESKLRMSTAV